MNRQSIILGSIVIVLLLILLIPSEVRKSALGGARSGSYGTIVATSTIEVGPQENKMLYANKQNCLSRVVSTVNQPIMIAFGATATTSLTGAAGHVHLASTTISYDSATYGCGQMIAYGFASSTITTAELR